MHAHELSQAIFRVENLSYTYPNQETAVLRGVWFALHAGQSIGLMGPNGSGKTTFFRCITGLIQPQSGQIWLGEKQMKTQADFTLLRRQVGYALQEADDQLFFPQVQEDLEFGPLNLGCSSAEAADRAARALDLVNLPGFGSRSTDSLSGGEKKRVALAAILAMQPRALLLDEPTNALDEESGDRLAELLNQLECAKLVISHDKSFIERVCSACLTLVNGSLRPL